MSVSGTMAGGSAAAKARELRARAARLEAEAQQWDKGAEGERRTAAVLSALTARGYVVLHDLAIPGSKANIDHVVVGPSGVVVIETKAYTGNLRINDGTLWHGRYPLRKELAAAAFEADKVRGVVGSTGWSVHVRSLVCIHAESVPVDAANVLGAVQLCRPLDLLSCIEAAPSLLGAEHVSYLARVIEEALPPQQIPSPPAAPPPISSLPTESASRRRDARKLAPATQLQPRARRNRHRTGGPRPARRLNSAAWRMARVALQGVVIIVGALLMLALAGTALDAVGSSVTTTTSTTTVSSPDPLAEAPPAP